MEIIGEVTRKSGENNFGDEEENSEADSSEKTRSRRRINMNSKRWMRMEH